MYIAYLHTFIAYSFFCFFSMRFEIVLFAITAGCIANVYTEGNALRYIYSYKKYYKILGIFVGALWFYWLIKRNPDRAREFVMASNDYVKYMPIDRNTSALLTPILDFTTRNRNVQLQTSGGSLFPIAGMPPMGTGGGGTSGGNMAAYNERRIMNSGMDNVHAQQKTKRSVGETKKKFVASRQSWKCGDCGNQLNAWFEVDHKVKLEHGGSNHVDNLVALCRECHGKKTTIENL